jgi:hypothetical protein
MKLSTAIGILLIDLALAFTAGCLVAIAFHTTLLPLGIAGMVWHLSMRGNFYRASGKDMP